MSVIDNLTRRERCKHQQLKPQLTNQEQEQILSNPATLSVVGIRARGFASQNYFWFAKRG